MRGLLAAGKLVKQPRLQLQLQHVDTLTDVLDQSSELRHVRSSHESHDADAAAAWYHPDIMPACH